MKMCKFTWYYTIMVLLIFLQHQIVSSSMHLSPSMQKIALFQFKLSLAISTPQHCSYRSPYYYDYEIPSHPKTMNWSMSSNHCTWEGVSCEHKTGNVIGLDLSCSQLEGAILANSTLFQLSHLHFLNLSNNDFSLSNEFPQEFGFFAKGLTHLNLCRTHFSGRVPSGISHLYKLVSLDLNQEEYSKNIQLEEEVFKSVMQNMSQLRVLNLESVNISSVVPMNLSTSLRVLDLQGTGLHGELPQEVFHLPNLQVLHLSLNTKLTGMLPMNLSTSLRVLNLGDTGLHGELPQEVFHLPNLEVLCLSGSTNLTGMLPTNLSTSLRVLYLYDSGLYGVVPQEVFHLPNLEVLILYPASRSNLTGRLPKVKWGSSATLRYLYLQDIDIDGGIPDSIGFLESLSYLELDACNLSGPIPASIGNLSQLTYLGLVAHNPFDLKSNNLNGPIPTSIGNLGQLTLLDLSSNNLNGPIPTSIGNLGQLTFLHLSDNNLNGPIPTSIGNLDQLTNLGLRGNNLNGPIPTDLVNLTKLDSIYLSNNSLTGPLPPWLFHHPSLQFLYLGYNVFTGQLPGINSSKSHLQEFSCRNNLLYGPIPQSFSQLVYLNYLDLSSNNFSGVLDIEMFLSVEYLSYLDLSHNNLSVKSMATLPSTLDHLGLSSCNIQEFPHFSRDAEIELDYVDLSNNQIEGEIPHWIGLVDWVSGLSTLNLSHNRLTGDLENLPWNNLSFLDLQSNMLNGSLPNLICNSSFLEILNLSNNNLSGVLPVCPKNLTSLSVFDLRMNNIEGNLPSTLSNFRNLQSLNLYGNKLEGRIPSSFAEFTYLEMLDLGRNQINDTFPYCLEALPNLQVLGLKSNQFHGLINKSSTVEHPFPSLRIMDLSDNKFSGPLPAIYFRNFKAMMNGEVNKIKRSYMEHSTYYSDSTTLVIKGVEVELIRILTIFTTIDVSSNHFDGEIVESIGNLASLRYLNLSHNYLRGHISSEIGKLSMLESLDLSSNQLEGEIPQQLTNIYSLSLLNLSCNQLSGHIPQGSQFNTFENDSYVGNLRLCGKPLSKECEYDIVMQKEGEDEDEYFFDGFTWEAVVIGYGCGVVPAFIIGYLMLLAGKPKWYAGIIGSELGLKIRRMEISMRL